MFFNQDSTCVLKAKLTEAVAASQLKISVTYRDNTDDYHQDAIVSTDDTTAVTLLAAPTGSVVNIVGLIKIYNPDTEANTVQILANDDVIASCAVGAGQTVMLSSEGIGSSGYVSADTDLSNLTTAGKAKVANLAMPSNSYINLTLGAPASLYTAPADGYIVLSKYATASSQYVYLTAITSGLSSGFISHAGNELINIYLPVLKNQSIGYDYNLGGATNYFRFVYAQGEV